MPCSEKRARLMLSRGRAVFVRLYPFVIRLKDLVDGSMQPLRLGIDPGSKTTGLALSREHEEINAATGAMTRVRHALWLAEVKQRGQGIRAALTARRAMRRARRARTTRYRAARFLNRTKPTGWLAPSLQHRVDTTVSWVRRLQRWAPLTAISQELVRFDMQAMQHPEINGVEYQQGTLAGYEVREYLLEQWGRQCVYCDAKQVPLQIEHIHARAKGGSDRVSNLTMACESCNTSKGAMDVREFLAHRPERLTRMLTQAKAPLRDAAAVNSTRWALFNQLKTTGLPVETGTGGRTKWNRARFDIPKAHALDALCVGHMDAAQGWERPTLTINATGRGSYQRTRLTAQGFPRGFLMRGKSVKGFQTGDMVSAAVPKGVKAGRYTGRVAVRASGSFNIQTPQGVIQGVSHRHCCMTQRADGYGYSFNPIAPQKGVREQGYAVRAARSLPGMNAEVSRAI